MDTERLTAELLEVLGEDDLFLLVEAFGGTRLNIPSNIRPKNEIALSIGFEAAERMSARFAPAVLRVPLCRELRAVRYRQMGRSNAAIARLLGITEGGVDKIFARMNAKTSSSQERDS
ncbi:hypothetical protein [Sphingomonas melonis]|uniref:hypothetical protein n=1 Tax=Sphingomonas melonis TaxID=152682 RepID=UPI0035C8478D